MIVTGTVSLTHGELQEIVAAHVNTKFGINISAGNVSLYQDPDDRTGCKISCSASVGDFVVIIPSPVGGTITDDK